MFRRHVSRRASFARALRLVFTNRPFSYLTGLALALTPSAAPGRAEPRTGRCASDTWSRPVPLAAGSTGQTIVRLPSVAPYGTGFAVVGNRMPPLSLTGTTTSYDSTLRAFIGFRVSDSGAIAALPTLPSPALALLPRAGTAPDGTLHMIWFQPDSSDRPRYPPDPTEPGTLWTLGANEGSWARPRPILSARVVGWDDISGSDLVASTRDLRFAGGLSSPSAQGGDELLVGTLLGDSVRQQRISLHGLPAPRSVALAVTPDGENVVVMLTPGTAGGRAIPQVLRSSRGRSRWSEPSPLPNDPPRSPSGIRLVVTPDATMHAIWVIGSDDPALARGLRHVESRDGGRTWSRAVDFDAGEHVYEPKVAVDRCGIIHVVYSSFGRVGRARLGHVLLANGAWRRASSSPFGNPSLDPALTRLADSTLVLVWSRPDSATQRMLDDLHVATLLPDIALRLPHLPRFETVYSILAAPWSDRARSGQR